MSFTKAASCSLGNVVHLGNVHYVRVGGAEWMAIFFFILVFCCSVHFTLFVFLSFTFLQARLKEVLLRAAM